jgi:hypothetical protein
MMIKASDREQKVITEPAQPPGTERRKARRVADLKSTYLIPTMGPVEVRRLQSAGRYDDLNAP